jgi:pyroglutamyl-peptidase
MFSRRILARVKVLLTGFMPWGTWRRNPSGDVALALGGHALPVDYAAADRALRRLLRKEKPDAILLLGLASGRRTISLETLALNVDHCEDRGYRRWRRPIGKGPLVLPTRLPVDRLHRLLKRAGIPVRMSHHAGTFICNHVFYVALASTRVPCGFVHVPPFSAVSQARQMRAVRLILEALRRGPTSGSTRSAPRRARSRRASSR